MTVSEDDQRDDPVAGCSAHEYFENDFEEVVEALCDFVLESDEPTEVGPFFQEHGAFVSKPLEDGGSNDPNFLCRLVSMMNDPKDMMTSENLEPFAKHIVENWPYLLRTPGNEGQTPMYRAIMQGNHRLVDVMANSCRDEKVLEDAIGYPSSDKKNCLHVAFETNFHAETTQLLIGKANKGTLGKRDGKDGRTPAHYAVKFEQCLGSRVETIRSLIERDDHFMAMTADNLVDEPSFLDEVDINGASVYRTLQEEIRAATIRYEKKTELMRQQSASQTKTSHRAEKPAAVGSKDSVTKDTKPPRDRRTTATMPPENKRNIDRLRGRPEGNNVVDEREKKRQAEKEKEAKDHDQLKRKHLETGRKKDGGAGSIEQRASERRAGDDGKVAIEIGHDQQPQLGVLSNTGVKRGEKAAPEDQPTKRRLGKQKTRNEFMTNYESMKENSETILLELRLHYLRTRTTEKALSFIHGVNKNNIHLSFDYEQLPRTIDWGGFIQRFGNREEDGIRFDKVLKRVSFPAVTVQHSGEGSEAAKEKFNSGIGVKGRRDMENFFEWLHRKGVRYILQLEVQDLRTTNDTKVHTDLSIRTCLQGFIVEHLDWRKLDMSPEVLHRIDAETPKAKVNANDSMLRELTLQWSGNNAVLRAWSDPAILDMLPNLRQINLIRPPLAETIDGPDWIETLVKDFKDRLKLRGIDVRDEEGPKTASRRAGLRQHLRPTAERNSHQWIKSTTAFAERMQTFWQNTLGDFDEMLKGLGGTNASEKVRDEVIVALIDDGINLFEMDMPDKVLVGRSFDFQGGEAHPWFTSAKNHGTAMADHILQVCPMAKIYPVRLRTYQALEGTVQIDGRYIARAIEAALAQNAAIISISWSAPLPEEVETEVRKAMVKARNQHVLIFCSVPDHGNFAERHNLFPAELYRKDVILIGAADSNGARFEKSHEMADFYLPGVEVPAKPKGHALRRSVVPLVTNPEGTRATAESPVSSPSPQPQNLTGSSIATALGAGLAALLLYSVKAAVLALAVSNKGQDAKGLAVRSGDVENLNLRENMMAAFSGLGVNVSTSYIEVWKELEKLTEAMLRVHHPGWHRCTVKDKEEVREKVISFVDMKLKKR